MRYCKVLFPLMMALIASSCEKNSDEIVKNTHRIKEYVYDHQNNLNDLKQEFDYENEKLVRIKYYAKDESDNWYLNSKDTITYSEGMYISTNFTLTGGTYQYASKLEMKIENGLVKEENCFLFNDQGSWDKYRKTIYQYSGKNLSKWFYFFDEDEDGVNELCFTGVYTYVEDTLESIVIDYTKNYSDDDDARYRFMYSEGQLTTVKRYYQYNVWKEKSKIEYAYVNELISEADAYTSQNGQWIFEKNTTFDYDAFENWIGCSTSDYTITNVYEEGHGNATYFFYDEQELCESGPTIKRASIDPHVPVPYIKKSLKGLIDLVNL